MYYIKNVKMPSYHSIYENACKLNKMIRVFGLLNDFSNRWCKRENVEPDVLKEWKINIFRIIDSRISFYSRNTHILLTKPKSSFRHHKRGIQDFHMNYVLAPADKAANNVVVVWRLYYINTLKRELVDTNAYKLPPSLSERVYVIVDGHDYHTSLHLLSKLKKIKTKFLRCTGYLNSIKPI